MPSKKPNISWGDDALKLVMKMLNNAQKKGKPTQAIRVGKNIDKQLASQGRRVEAKVVRGKVTQIDDLAKGAAKTERDIANKRIIKEQSRSLGASRLGEAVESKGSKMRGGKEVRLSVSQAKAAVSQGKRASAQRAKGNASKKAVQDKLRSRIAGTKDAAEKRRLRQQLRNHENKYGRFK